MRAIFKKATYSMSLECIENLKHIAETERMNRSVKLLRCLLHYFYQLPPKNARLYISLNTMV